MLSGSICTIYLDPEPNKTHSWLKLCDPNGAFFYHAIVHNDEIGREVGRALDRFLQISREPA